jgi:hypothetical protein
LARISSWWLIISASAGASLKVLPNACDKRINIPEVTVGFYVVLSIKAAAVKYSSQQKGRQSGEIALTFHDYRREFTYF